MTHPFRHELDAAHSRIDQLERELTESRERSRDTIPPRGPRPIFHAPLMFMIGSVGVAVAFSVSAVSRMNEGCPAGQTHAQYGLNAEASMLHAPIVTVSPKGLSSWQIGNVASKHAGELATACGPITEPREIDLEVDVDADGNVIESQAHGPNILASCTETQARIWRFPTGDGATHARVPIYFRPNIAGSTRPVEVPPQAAQGESGSISVTCIPQCDTVLEDGEPIGRAQILAHPTTAGRHTLELISGTHKRVLTAVVYPGRTTEVRQDMSDAADLGVYAPL
jgi:hypothetical protein